MGRIHDLVSHTLMVKDVTILYSFQKGYHSVLSAILLNIPRTTICTLSLFSVTMYGYLSHS